MASRLSSPWNAVAHACRAHEIPILAYKYRRTLAWVLAAHRTDLIELDEQFQQVVLFKVRHGQEPAHDISCLKFEGLIDQVDVIGYFCAASHQVAEFGEFAFQPAEDVGKALVVLAVHIEQVLLELGHAPQFLFGVNAQGWLRPLFRRTAARLLRAIAAAIGRELVHHAALERHFVIEIIHGIDKENRGFGKP